MGKAGLLRVPLQPTAPGDRLSPSDSLAYSVHDNRTPRMYCPPVSWGEEDGVSDGLCPGALPGRETDSLEGKGKPSRCSWGNQGRPPGGRGIRAGACSMGRSLPDGEGRKGVAAHVGDSPSECQGRGWCARAQPGAEDAPTRGEGLWPQEGSVCSPSSPPFPPGPLLLLLWLLGGLGPQPCCCGVHPHSPGSGGAMEGEAGAGQGCGWLPDAYSPTARPGLCPCSQPGCGHIRRPLLRAQANTCSCSYPPPPRAAAWGTFLCLPVPRHGHMGHEADYWALMTKTLGKRAGQGQWKCEDARGGVGGGHSGALGWGGEARVCRLGLILTPGPQETAAGTEGEGSTAQRVEQRTSRWASKRARSPPRLRPCPRPPPIRTVWALQRLRRFLGAWNNTLCPSFLAAPGSVRE